jgi:hypothetical protein
MVKAKGDPKEVIDKRERRKQTASSTTKEEAKAPPTSLHHTKHRASKDEMRN